MAKPQSSRRGFGTIRWLPRARRVVTRLRATLDTLLLCAAHYFVVDKDAGIGTTTLSLVDMSYRRWVHNLVLKVAHDLSLDEQSLSATLPHVHPVRRR
jgi:hypothetical protein